MAEAMRGAVGVTAVGFRREDYDPGVSAAREWLESFNAAWAGP